MGKLQDAAVQFYAGCIVLALQQLHGLAIAYRDLKPENGALCNVWNGLLGNDMLCNVCNMTSSRRTVRCHVSIA